jgi:hypothetical protein
MPTSTPPAVSTSNEPYTPSAVPVCFTPGGNFTDQIVKPWGDAKTSILVQAYRFTSAPVAKALLEAHKRGVRVEAIAENVLIIRAPALAAQYAQNWQAHAEHSQPYVGRGVRQ